MEVGFYKDVYHEYMVIDKNPEDKEGGFEEQLLHNKEIAGLLRMKMEYVSGCCKYYYDIGKMESLENIKSDKRLDYAIIISVFERIRKLMETLNDYLLIPDNLWLDAAGIYIKNGMEEIYFTYVPSYKKDFKEQLKELLSWLMKSIDHCQKDTVMFVYGLYKMLCEQSNAIEVLCKMECVKETKDFIKVSESESERQKKVYEDVQEDNIFTQESITFVSNDPKEDEDKENQEQSKGSLVWFLVAAAMILGGFLLNHTVCDAVFSVFGVYLQGWVIPLIFVLVACVPAFFGVKEVVFSVLAGVREREDKEFWKESQRPDYSSLVHDETSVLKRENPCSAGETSLLGGEVSKDMLVLKRMDENKFCRDIIYVTSTPFVIGKQYGSVDYQLGDDVISRRHLEIKKEGRRYEAVDLSSTNGTWLNGSKFKAGVTYEIKQGDMLKIANIPFSVIVRGR